MNLIAKELEESKKYELKKLEQDSTAKESVALVKLCRSNIAIVEAYIRNDSAYLSSSNEMAAPSKSFGGSTAFWMMQLKSLLNDGNDKSQAGYSFNNVVMNAVCAVDRENSTHLNADQVGRTELAKRIIEHRDNLVYELKRPMSDYKLVLRLADATHPDVKHKPRRNLSFASKFCHYASYCLFKGSDKQDAYSNYDSVVSKILPRYLRRYGIAEYWV